MAGRTRGPASTSDALHARLLGRALRPFRLLGAPGARTLRRRARDVALPTPRTAVEIAAEMHARLHPACSGSARVQHLTRRRRSSSGPSDAPRIAATRWSWDVLGRDEADEGEWPAEGHYVLQVDYASGRFALARGNELLLDGARVALRWWDARQFLPPLTSAADCARVAGHSR